ncbi:MAG: hypothetical protein M1839_005356 [Geoglossum umbratile]|nr:MAG: hypothetical protein M1839_005356 [Geoglossum umbratile]
MDNRQPSSWTCPYCSQCFSVREELRNDLRDHIKLRLHNVLPEILKILLKTADHDRLHKYLELHLRNVLPEVLEVLLKAVCHDGSENPNNKTHLKCPHHKCKGRKAFAKRSNLVRHYQSRMASSLLARRKTNETSNLDIKCNAQCGFCGCSSNNTRGFIAHVRKCMNEKSTEQETLRLNREQRQTIKLMRQLGKQANEMLEKADQTDKSDEEQVSSSCSGDESSEEGREQSDRPKKRQRTSISTGDSSGPEPDKTATNMESQHPTKRQHPDKNISLESDMWSSGRPSSLRCMPKSETGLSDQDGGSLKTTHQNSVFMASHQSDVQSRGTGRGSSGISSPLALQSETNLQKLMESHRDLAVQPSIWPHFYNDDSSLRTLPIRPPDDNPPNVCQQPNPDDSVYQRLPVSSRMWSSFPDDSVRQQLPVSPQMWSSFPDDNVRQQLPVSSRMWSSFPNDNPPYQPKRDLPISSGMQSYYPSHDSSNIYPPATEPPYSNLNMPPNVWPSGNSSYDHQRLMMAPTDTYVSSDNDLLIINQQRVGA